MYAAVASVRGPLAAAVVIKLPALIRGRKPMMELPPVPTLPMRTHSPVLVVIEQLSAAKGAACPRVACGRCWLSRGATSKGDLDPASADG